MASGMTYYYNSMKKDRFFLGAKKWPYPPSSFIFAIILPINIKSSDDYVLSTDTLLLLRLNGFDMISNSGLLAAIKRILW